MNLMIGEHEAYYNYYFRNGQHDRKGTVKNKPFNSVV